MRLRRPMNCRFFRRSNFLTIRDVMVPAYSAYVISQEAPDVKLILYPDAGHAFLFQHAEAFTQDVLRFLAA